MNTDKKLFLNEYEFYTTYDLTLNEILYYFNYQQSIFVVEYNNLICDKTEWDKIKLNSNDKIEIITIVGGG